ASVLAPSADAAVSVVGPGIPPTLAFRGGVTAICTSRQDSSPSRYSRWNSDLEAGWRCAGSLHGPAGHETREPGRVSRRVEVGQVEPARSSMLTLTTPPRAGQLTPSCPAPA